MIRIDFKNVAKEKCSHSQVDKKHYVVQVLSYRHQDKNICINTSELWWQNGTYPGFRKCLGLPRGYINPSLHL